MVDLDERECGCFIVIHMNDNKHTEDLPQSMNWLRTRSGLSKEYVDKVLSVQLHTSALKSSLTVYFDASANCFEAMQQIHSKSEWGDVKKSSNDVWEVICPCGGFRNVRRLFRCGTELSGLMSTAKRELEKFGEVLRLTRYKIDGVNTGDVEAVMFMTRDSQLMENEFLKRKRNEYKVSIFHPTPETRIEEPVVRGLWDKYGPVDDDEEEVEDDVAVMEFQEVDVHHIVGNIEAMKAEILDINEMGGLDGID